MDVDVSTGYLLVTGSRKVPTWLHATLHTKLHAVLYASQRAYKGEIERFEILVGDAPGIDKKTVLWAQSQQSLPVTLHERSPFLVNWDAACDQRCAPDHRRTRFDGTDYCPAQGVYRNTEMVTLARQYHDAGAWVRVVAFYAEPNSKGTGDCARQALQARLVVREFGNAPERHPEQEVLSLRTQGAHELRQDGS